MVFHHLSRGTQFNTGFSYLSLLYTRAIYLCMLREFIKGFQRVYFTPVGGYNRDCITIYLVCCYTASVHRSLAYNQNTKCNDESARVREKSQVKDSDDEYTLKAKLVKHIIIIVAVFCCQTCHGL